MPVPISIHRLKRYHLALHEMSGNVCSNRQLNKQRESIWQAIASRESRAITVPVPTSEPGLVAAARRLAPPRTSTPLIAVK